MINFNRFRLTEDRILLMQDKNLTGSISRQAFEDWLETTSVLIWPISDGETTTYAKATIQEFWDEYQREYIMDTLGDYLASVPQSDEREDTWAERQAQLENDNWERNY